MPLWSKLPRHERNFLATILPDIKWSSFGFDARVDIDIDRSLDYLWRSEISSTRQVCDACLTWTGPSMPNENPPPIPRKCCCTSVQLVKLGIISGTTTSFQWSPSNSSGLAEDSLSSIPSPERLTSSSLDGHEVEFGPAVMMVSVRSAINKDLKNTGDRGIRETDLMTANMLRGKWRFVCRIAGYGSDAS